MDERIIEAVRAFPCLWQVSSRSYKDLVVKLSMFPPQLKNLTYPHASSLSSSSSSPSI